VYNIARRNFQSVKRQQGGFIGYDKKRNIVNMAGDYFRIGKEIRTQKQIRKHLFFYNVKNLNHYTITQ
jgi:hypothetical protein